MRKFVAIPILICTFALFGMVVSCKQGAGERCQVDSDCTDGLTCNRATQACVGENADDPIEAGPPIDAPDAPPDADEPDAPPDAAI